LLRSSNETAWCRVDRDNRDARRHHPWSESAAGRFSVRREPATASRAWQSHRVAADPRQGNEMFLTMRKEW